MTAAGQGLRIAFATTSYPLRAGDFSGHFVHSLAVALVARGHAVSVVAPHAPGAAESEDLDGVAVRRFRYAPEAFERVAYGDGVPANVRRDPRALVALPGFVSGLSRAVARTVDELGADLVHAQWAPTAAFVPTRALADRALVVTLHGSDVALARRGGAGRALFDRGLARAAQVLCVSSEQASFVRSSGAFHGPVHVAPSGVPASLLDRERPERDPSAPFTYLYAGRLVEGKGVPDLVAAFARVYRARGGVRLRIVGAGAQEGAVRERVAASGVGEAVEFAGPLPHAEALDAIAAADCLVLPSHAEGSPLSVTEALALGTPVVGTRVGGVPDLLGEAGLLADPGDVGALAEGMMHALLDTHRRAGLVREGRERVAAHLTWDRVAEVHEAVYRATLERVRRG